VEGDPAFAWNVMQTLLAAETLGAAEAALTLAVEYAKQRKAFGRAIGSFQAVKHQLTDALRLNENARSLIYFAAYAAGNEPAGFGLAANAARLAADTAADECTRRGIAVHGGLGATWEHDAHLYFRRAQLSRLLLGGQYEAGERVVSHVLG
jgi:alkylation response protein AidB-like acyl-CoA dehydrogenase